MFTGLYPLRTVWRDVALRATPRLSAVSRADEEILYRELGEIGWWWKIHKRKMCLTLTDISSHDKRTTCVQDMWQAGPFECDIWDEMKESFQVEIMCVCLFLQQTIFSSHLYTSGFEGIFPFFLIFFIRIDNPLEVDTFLLFFLSGKKSNILKIGKTAGKWLM